MRKFQAVLLALVTVAALSAVVVASASAEITLVALWLSGTGVEITTALATETVGNILLEDTKVPLVGDAAVLCSGILDGTVNAEGKDEITKVLNLKNEELGAPLVGRAFSFANGDCINELNCGAPAEVWPLNLPWRTQLFLMENGEILDLIVGSGYEILCTELGENVIDECTAADTESRVENDPETGDAATPALAKAEPNATCTLSKEATGVNQVDELTEIKLVNGELLTVSSE